MSCFPNSAEGRPDRIDEIQMLPSLMANQVGEATAVTADVLWQSRLKA